MAATDKRKDADHDSTTKVAPKKEGKDKPNGTIKLKRPAPKHSKPGNWRDGSVIGNDDKKTKGTPTPSTATASVPSPGPVVNQLDDNARDTFATGRPLEDSPELHLCKHCKKSILKTAAKAHVSACLRQKKEKALRKKEAKEAREKAKDKEKEAADPDKAKNKKTDGDGDTKMEDTDDDGEEEKEEGKKVPGGAKGVKKSTKKADADGEKKGKKRKADTDADKGPKPKKKKEEPKPKAPKAKGPVDVEKQCGVITPNGAPCARSLTCKSHSMGAKRAVPGRSLPYDMLLTAYQKKNQAKQQKAAIDANAPLEDEDDANAGPVDSDEEMQLVMGSLAKWRPRPIVEQPVLVPIRRVYQEARLRSEIDNATNGGTINMFGPTPPSALQQQLPLDIDADADDAPGEPEFGMGAAAVQSASRRSSSAFGMAAPPSRKASVAAASTK